jgi:hypothetical protein
VIKTVLARLCGVCDPSRPCQPSKPSPATPVNATRIAAVLLCAARVHQEAQIITARAFTSAGRFSPLGPRGMLKNGLLIANICT